MKRILNFIFDPSDPQYQTLPEEVVDLHRKRTIERARREISEDIAKRIPIERAELPQDRFPGGRETYEAGYYICNRENAEQIEKSLHMLETMLPMSGEIVANIRRELNW